MPPNRARPAGAGWPALVAGMAAYRRGGEPPTAAGFHRLLAGLRARAGGARRGARRGEARP